MSKKINEDIFDYILGQALADCGKDEISAVEADTAKADTSETFKVFFKKFIAKRKRQLFVEAVPMYAKRAAISVVTMVAMLFCVLMTQPPVYAAVKGVFYSWEEQWLEYSIDGDKSIEAKTYYGIRANYLPPQYRLFQATIQPDTFSIITFDNPFDINVESSDIILMCSDVNAGGNGGVDNEHGVRVPMEIEGFENVLYIQSTYQGYPSTIMGTREGYFYSLGFPSSQNIDDITRMMQNFEIIY